MKKGSMDSKQSITVEHKGIVITYNEYQNQWTFTLRNRERSVETLVQARQMIDRPAPADKSCFKPVQVWFIDSDGLKSGKVTSVTVQRYRTQDPQCRISYNNDEGKIERIRQFSSMLYPSNPHNDALAKSVKDLDSKIKELRNQKAGLQKQLIPLQIPEEPSDQD